VVWCVCEAWSEPKLDLLHGIVSCCRVQTCDLLLSRPESLDGTLSIRKQRIRLIALALLSFYLALTCGKLLLSA